MHTSHNWITSPKLIIIISDILDHKNFKSRYSSFSYVLFFYVRISLQHSFGGHFFFLVTIITNVNNKVFFAFSSIYSLDIRLHWTRTIRNTHYHSRIFLHTSLKSIMTFLTCICMCVLTTVDCGKHGVFNWFASLFPFIRFEHFHLYVWLRFHTVLCQQILSDFYPRSAPIQVELKRKKHAANLTPYLLSFNSNWAKFSVVCIYLVESAFGVFLAVSKWFDNLIAYLCKKVEKIRLKWFHFPQKFNWIWIEFNWLEKHVLHSQSCFDDLSVINSKFEIIQSTMKLVWFHWIYSDSSFKMDNDLTVHFHGWPFH